MIKDYRPRSQNAFILPSGEVEGKSGMCKGLSRRKDIHMRNTDSREGQMTGSGGGQALVGGKRPLQTPKKPERVRRLGALS